MAHYEVQSPIRAFVAGLCLFGPLLCRARLSLVELKIVPGELLLNAAGNWKPTTGSH